MIFKVSLTTVIQVNVDVVLDLQKRVVRSSGKHILCCAAILANNSEI